MSILNIKIFKKYLDSIVLLDIRVRISDSSSIMGYNVRNLVWSHRLFGDFAEFKGSFFLVNPVGLEPTLNIIKDTEELSSLFNCDDIHHTKRESSVSSNFAVNLDQSFLVLNNLDNLSSSECVLQSILEKNCQGDALSCLVG